MRSPYDDKVQKVHKVLLDLLDLSFSRGFSFFLGLDRGNEASKDDDNTFNVPAQQVQKIETTYNPEGSKGPEGFRNEEKDQNRINP